ncbi:Very-long-chain (3R)-3-hydroxyacyl-CoA dehydratase PASTICCINO 2 [Porphyridium purpureum]|uniref:very-long-chain (3R)-3-hydroxyacyl-CoA dehydratase n=1 Tax=Porphyridium purpureum TaxID=35688 RepID=A0A5J4Z155_PORPP|nr:Very-long-chain (3R)-3-hydroxyacyl-CoA dehydratase PASTICCINO 2 [Porphyridium purpureum]|eukprot:POR6391..scf295_1
MADTGQERKEAPHATTDKSSQAPQAQRAYLLIYNVAQLVLYTVVLCVSIGSAVAFRSASRVFEHASPFLSAAQYLAYLEIGHALLGFAGSSVKAACIQVLGRNLVYFGVLMCVPEAYSSPFVLLLFVSWALADLVRFPVYVLKLLQVECPSWLNWLRYSAFLLLYPSGISAEIGVVVVSLPYIKQSRVNFVSLGGTLIFNFYIFCLCGLASYAYFGPTMYMYMLKQRKRNLSLSGRDATKNKEPKPKSG